MRGIKTKSEKDWKKVFLSSFLLLVLILLLNSLSKVYKKKQEAELALTRMQNQFVELQKRDANLKSEIQKLNTKEGMEFEIRKKLNVAQAGESVAIVVENEDGLATTTLKISPWQKFKNSVINLFK